MSTEASLWGRLRSCSTHTRSSGQTIRTPPLCRWAQVARRLDLGFDETLIRSHRIYRTHLQINISSSRMSRNKWSVRRPPTVWIDVIDSVKVFGCWPIHCIALFKSVLVWLNIDHSGQYVAANDQLSDTSGHSLVRLVWNSIICSDMDELGNDLYWIIFSVSWIRLLHSERPASRLRNWSFAKKVCSLDF